MLLLRTERLPEGPDLYELKLDGSRALAIKSGGKVRLRSRNDKDFNGNESAGTLVLARLLGYAYTQVHRRRFMTISLRRKSISLASVLTCASLALAHIRIAPTESVPGAREKCTMRVPNEKQVNTIRVEGEFPAGLQNL